MPKALRASPYQLRMRSIRESLGINLSEGDGGKGEGVRV